MTALFLLFFFLFFHASIASLCDVETAENETIYFITSQGIHQANPQFRLFEEAIDHGFAVFHDWLKENNCSIQIQDTTYAVKHILMEDFGNSTLATQNYFSTQPPFHSQKRNQPNFR